METLDQISAEIIACRRCPRLVEWREAVGREKRASFRDWEYWARPIPGFGDPEATVLVLGLAPAAHGGNRTGRIFTGDSSGDWLFGALYRAGFTNQPTSTHRDDGIELRGLYIAAPVRCAPPENKPTIVERDTCQPFLEREFRALRNLKVIVPLGAFAYEAVGRLTGLRPRPKFAHGREVALPGGLTAVCSYHPSQHNTFTGRLTVPMFDAVFARARALVSAP